MPSQLKPKRVGRPALPKRDAKGHIVPVRLKANDFKMINQAAKKSGQTVSEWIRGILNTALEA